MRKADGRPRGFGYVTFESPAAAALCLSHPVAIDGRVVDLKLATPILEGESTKDVKAVTQRSRPNHDGHGAGANSQFPSQADSTRETAPAPRNACRNKSRRSSDEPIGLLQALGLASFYDTAAATPMPKRRSSKPTSTS